MRIFIAIKLNNEVKSHIKRLSDNLAPYFEKARFSHIENYHITIKFIGETNRSGFEKVVSVVKRAAAGINRFAIRTGGPGSFKRRNRHIFYCSVNNSENLQRLHDLVCRELEDIGLKSDSVKFSPHITIAREVLLYDGNPEIEYESKEINVNEITVMESTRINGKLTYIPRFTVELGGQNG